MHTAIIIDEAYGDAAADSIKAVLSKSGTSEIRTLSEFLLDAGVHVDEESGYLTKHDVEFGRRYGDQYAVCNRVVDISEKTMSVLDGTRDILKPNFVLTAYAHLLQEMPKVWGALTPYPAGKSLPLYLQWRAFAAHVRDIETPRFAYAFGAEEPTIGEFREPLWKSPFDLYNWEVADGASRPDVHAFVVDKPLGRPVVAYFSGDVSDAFDLSLIGELDEAIKLRLTTCMTTIREAFKSFMGESLFFIDEGRIVFGAFSQFLKTSVVHERFSSVMERGLV